MSDTRKSDEQGREPEVGVDGKSVFIGSAKPFCHPSGEGVFREWGRSPAFATARDGDALGGYLAERGPGGGAAHGG